VRAGALALLWVAVGAALYAVEIARLVIDKLG
jgi:hypothetical protein